MAQASLLAASATAPAKTDTIAEFNIVSGKVFDKQTSAPLVFAAINVVGTSIGTISNTEGEFVIKTPGNLKNYKLGFSSVGYESRFIDHNDLLANESAIWLKAATIPINEVKIRDNNPQELLKLAIEKYGENYYAQPAELTAFYRETIKQQRSYVAISEAILDVYKAKYGNANRDQLKLYKGRESLDVKKMDTIFFKLQGGPSSMLLMDVVSNSNMLLATDVFDYYEYNFAGTTIINDKLNYVIEFDQKESVKYPLYKGKIYLDEKNLAIAGIEFHLSERGIGMARDILVRKKPLTMKVDPLSAFYKLSYKEEDGQWYLSHARSELVFKCNWKKRLFNSTYTVMSEMAITDRSTNNVKPYKPKEAMAQDDVFVENINKYYDEAFWEGFNYIKPEEPIEKAVERINKKTRHRAGEN
ncbi:MAG: carboxypeptidase-like regulatory domain-containing protein [Bacteroidales bacterium]|nr:carboxypeptidase-like regulatory domain-containing protein [Bacteroidales bacterium]